MSYINKYNDELICDYLLSYLSNTSLSMEQVSRKWEVSSATLSQIKSGKRGAGVDLGLKILREAGATITERTGWLDKKRIEDSQEALLFKKEVKQNKVEKSLKDDFCNILENNPALVDVFLDVALAQEAGVSRISLIKNYGDFGLDLLKPLIEMKIIYICEDRYYIEEKNLTFVTNETSSFGIVKALFEAQRMLKNRGLFKGYLQYDIVDVTKECYEKIIERNKKYVSEIREILESHEKHRFDGGVRVICQSLVSLSKGQLDS